jgi:hypothetical protein
MRRPPLRLLGIAAVAAGILAVGALPALADVPLATPTNLQAQHISDTSADVWWLRDGGAKEDVVEQRVNGVWHEYARGLFGAISLTNLTRGTTYTFRVYSIAYAGSGFTNSARSAPISFTTLSAPDSVPPSKPPAPTFSSITTTVVNIFWAEATDNVQVTGYYLQQLSGGVWTTIRTVGPGERFQTIGGLSPATTYTFAEIAFDARGNQSARSDPGSVTTLPATPQLTCRAQVITYNPGFQATATIVNTTSTATNGWTVQFTLPATATASTAFNGTLTRNGNVGTITPFVWSAVIGPGGQLTVGFSGSATPFTPPTNFTLNGVPCTNV